MSVVPINQDGSQKKELIEQYIAERRRKEAEWKREEEERFKECILNPTPCDVLVGRGRSYQELFGNTRYSRIIDSYLETYMRAAGRFEKTCIFMAVIRLIEDSNGRFLQRTSDGWKQVSDYVAKERVSYSFRTKSVKMAIGIPVPPPSHKTSLEESSKRIRYDKEFLTQEEMPLDHY